MQLGAQQAALLGVTTKPEVTNAFYKATQLDKAGDYVKSGRIYDELLNADFDNPVVLAAFGMNYAARERNGLAFQLLQRSLQNFDSIMDGFKRVGCTPKTQTTGDQLDFFLKAKRSEILNAIGTCYKHENKCDEARSHFEQAQSLLPSTNPDIQNNLATLYINEGHPEKALVHLDLALDIAPDHPQARWNKSLVLLELGDYEGGWGAYDAGFPARVRVERNYAPTPLPTWNGRDGQTVVVYGEQGIGDEIMFASCLPELLQSCKKVVFDCHKKLHGLFHSSFPELEIYPTREEAVLTWPQRYQFDARIAIGSLPKFFRPNLESFQGQPYITPDSAKVRQWGQKLDSLGRKPKIGIHWIGGHKRTRVEVRSLPLEKFLPVLRQDATFVSLQYTDCKAEIDEFSQKYGIPIHYFPEATHSEDYGDTAALVANLDLVITVCTSVVHLAGSMGVPTWVLTPSRPAWRYRLDLDYMPWYGKAVTLFRQQPDSTDWTPVVEEVSNSLAAMLSAIKEPV